MFITVCLNPVLQKTLCLSALQENQVNRLSCHQLDASGKGVNVSRILSLLGAGVVHLTQSGGGFHFIFREFLKKEKFRSILVPSGAELRFCYTILTDRGSATEIVEEGRKVKPDTGKKILSEYQKLLVPGRAVVISGTRAPGFRDDIFPLMVKLAVKKKCCIILDYRGRDLIDSLQYKPHFVKINLQEFAATFLEYDVKENFAPAGVVKKIKQILPEIYNKYGTRFILTGGSRNIIFFDGKACREYRPRKITPVNTVGCGDAFTAGFIFEYMRSENFFLSVKTAEKCAGKNALCLRPGCF